MGARASYLRYRAGAALARALPAPVAPGAAAVLGTAVCLASPAKRSVVARHLRRVHGGDLAGPALGREVRRAFVSYSRYWMESFRLPGSTPAELDAHMSYEGLEHLEDALALGRGVIMAMPHLGGWDFAGAWLVGVGGYHTTVVVEPVEPPELFAWFCGLRRSLGLEIVSLGSDAGTAVLRRLRQGGIVGLVCDRDIRSTGVEVELFGERTTIPSGPAALALRTGAPILPTAVYFRGRRGHFGVVRPAILAERGARFREDVGRVSQLLASELEALIRRAPDQWHLFQPNWPSDQPGAAGPPAEERRALP